MMRQIRSLSFVVILFNSCLAMAQLDFEQEPILYSSATATDAVSQLIQKLKSGDTQITWERQHGYLKSLLKELAISESSQLLVFSRTSLQVNRITPKTPRAIYFNDNVYIGWVQHGDVIELSAADPQLGGTFYTLDQRSPESPTLTRETGKCLQCHGSSHTRRTPGHIVRSVFPDSGGQPVYRLGTHITDDSSPFRERWGGWYVTGMHGQQRHMGNCVLADPDVSEKLDVESGANVTDLSSQFDLRPYLTPHSDIVALMVLQHQVAMHNILTAANHSGRITMRDSAIMNKALERLDGFESESTERRFSSAAENVVRGLLFCEEAQLTHQVTGTSGFAAEFAARGPFDSKGRSFRHFDLRTRMFQYPCSFLIYSESFTSLPSGVKARVWKRLSEVLSGEETSSRFEHLSPEDRMAIREILLETHPDAKTFLVSSNPVLRSN